MENTRATELTSDFEDLNYYFLWAITGSIRITSDNVLFDERQKLDLNKRIESCFGEKALKKNHLDEFQLMSLCQLADVKLENTTEYRYPYKTCKILNFNDMPQQQVEDEWQNEWYRIRSCKEPDGNVIFNEWVINGTTEYQSKMINGKT